MGLYNALFGVNPTAPILLQILGLRPEDFGRFRDAWVDEDGNKIVVLTRNGGGNREWLKDVIARLESHPLHEANYDDEYDPTYAYFVFRVPEEWRPLTAAIARAQGDEYFKPLRERFEALVRELEGVPAEVLERDPRIGDLVKTIREATSELQEEDVG